MDTLVLPEWAGLFSHVEFDVSNRTERYTEIRSRCHEPGLGAAAATIVLTPGITLSQLVFQVQEPLFIQTGTTEEEVQSVFMLDGMATSNFYNMPGQVTAEKNKHSFQYSPNFAGSHRINPGRFEVLHLSFNIPFLQSILQPAQDQLADSICNRIERKESFPLAPVHQRMQAGMLDILRAMQQCTFGGMTRLLYLEAKTLELFSLQLQQLTSEPPAASNPISRSDAEKLRAVRQYVEVHYLQPLSLTQLGTDFNLNEFKLKKGYKALFGTTVFGHIYTLRMTKAKQLLEEGRLNVSEVSDLIGYCNVPAFSAAFKKSFGYPPSTLARLA